MRDLILRRASTCLRRRLSGLRDDGGRGAVAVLVAILLGTGVLLGMAALVVDVGQLYQNRAELQNGADAAALAVAKSCAAGSCDGSIATATGYASANASSLTGHKAYVNFVCGAAGAGGAGATGTIPVGTGQCVVAKTVCPANPPAGQNYVDVETSTLMPSNSHLLPPVFAETLTGNSNYSGSTVYACAQVQWHGPAVGSTVGITLGYCDWAEATSTGTSYPPLPPYTTSSTPLPVVINFHDPKGQEGETGCPSGPAGQTASGNFGWTADPNNNCLLSSSNFTLVGGSYTYGGNTGNNTPTDCQSVLSSAQASQTVLYVPVYSSYNGQGSKATYNLSSLAPFVVTGYSFGKQFQVKDRVTQTLCGGNGKNVTCISGYFVHQIDQTPGSLGNADLGYDIIKLTG